MADKTKEAIALVTACIGTKGVWASTERYREQCWTRDFCIATSYLLMNYPSLANMNTVCNHLYNLSQRQDPSGKIPILYLDDEIVFLRDKIEKSILAGKISFMLKRYLEKDISNLTPHTRDSELLFIITASEFLNHATKTNFNVSELVRSTISSARYLAMDYIRVNLLKDSLVPGADWRDTRDDLDDKYVLTNACLLYRAYQSINMMEDANNVKNILQKKYWNGKFFDDYEKANSFDILGNSLTIIYGIADRTQSDCIFEYAMVNIHTPFGFKMTDTFLPPQNETEKVIMARDKAVIWPFTNGFLIDAMITTGNPKWIKEARAQFSILEKLPGFYEWYDICEGKGYGSANQTWSAALYLRVEHKLNQL